MCTLLGGNGGKTLKTLPKLCNGQQIQTKKDALL